MAAGKHDVELERVRARSEFQQQALRYLFALLAIALSWIPLSVVKAMVSDVAGKETKVDANVAISFTLSVSVVLNGVQYFKGRSQRDELKKQRTRIADLEGRIVPQVGGIRNRQESQT